MTQDFSADATMGMGNAEGMQMLAGLAKQAFRMEESMSRAGWAEYVGNLVSHRICHKKEGEPISDQSCGDSSSACRAET